MLDRGKVIVWSSDICILYLPNYNAGHRKGYSVEQRYLYFVSSKIQTLTLFEICNKVKVSWDKYIVTSLSQRTTYDKRQISLRIYDHWTLFEHTCLYILWTARMFSRKYSLYSLAILWHRYSGSCKDILSVLEIPIFIEE